MSNHVILRALGAFSLAAATAAPGFAETAPAVALAGDVKVIRQVTENGRTSETLEEPSQVLPGDRLVFTTRYTNRGTEPASDFVVTNPLPAPVRLSKVESFEVSADGGQTFGPLAMLKVKAADGTPRPAELGDVTHVRWRLASIAPGASGEVKYFAEVR